MPRYGFAQAERCVELGGRAIPRRICVVNQKGGVGKTTTVFTLAAALSDLGRRVLCVDLDAQANLTSSFGFDPDLLDLTTADLFTREEVEAADVILETGIEGVHAIPADIKLVRRRDAHPRDDDARVHPADEARAPVRPLPRHPVRLPSEPEPDHDQRDGGEPGGRRPDRDPVLLDQGDQRPHQHLRAAQGEDAPRPEGVAAADEGGPADATGERHPRRAGGRPSAAGSWTRSRSTRTSCARRCSASPSSHAYPTSRSAVEYDRLARFLTLPDDERERWMALTLARA